MQELPQIESQTGKLTDDEVSFILQTSLKPVHHSDINILRFINNYMRCRDPKQAAVEAGLTASSGRALKARPDIHLAIARLTEKSLDKFGFSAEEVIERVKEIAFVDPLDLFNPDGSCKTKMADIAPEARRAIKSFKVKNLYETDPNGMKVRVGEIVEIQMWDKMKSVEFLGREKSLFKETTKVEHDITSNMASILLDSKSRGEQAYIQAREANRPSFPIIDVVPVLEEGKGE